LATRPDRGRSQPPTEPAPPSADLAARLLRLERDKEGLTRELAEGVEQLRGLARAVWRVEEEERARLARELHDGIGQSLTALAMRLERLATEAGAGSHLALRLGEALGVARQALSDTRHLAHLLRPPILDDLGLVPALRWLARGLGSDTGLAVDLAVEGLPDGRLPPELETLLFRVAQEALTNVAKHAGTDRAEVRLAGRGGWVVLTIADAGRGFDAEGARGTAATAPGFGLKGMRDRVECSAGRFTLRSAPGSGTRVEAALPLADRLGRAP
jgi:two-component system sensor histidine kinase UhpB